MLPSLLIANRGEIACRVIRTARRLGLRTIAVYSDADATAPHVRQADEAYPIGPAPARESYLRGDFILDVARRTGAAAIHPGYGFLSENAAFAEQCMAAGVVFVGPPPSAIRAMGLKDAAKALAEKAGVPVVPGYHGSRQEPEFLAQKAYEIGYPVLVKAVAGGGGKGMRRVDKARDFEEALASAKREAGAAFGDERVLVEKYVAAPRHVEVQVFGDTQGNVVHLFERDCSLQRRHQKVIEEAPAPGMTPQVRAAMGAAAVEAARAVGYVGAGTVEFIADGREGLRADRFYFMEMNTRLQVEHPVTEAITGLDLVELQLRVASGEPLPFAQSDLAIDGHAVEARLYAEDPEREFLPSTGRLLALRLPEGEGVRVDSGVAEGGEVTPFYDPMIAKVIAHGATRDEALDRLSAALGRTLVAGPRTNLAFLRALCDAPGFRAGAFDTGFIAREAEALGAGPREMDAEAVAAGVAHLAGEERRRVSPWSDNPSSTTRDRWLDDPWDASDSYQLASKRVVVVRVHVDGEAIDARVRIDPPTVEVGLQDDLFRPTRNYDAIIGMLVVEGDPATFLRPVDSQTVLAIRNGRQTRVALADLLAVDLDDASSGGLVRSPMHGRVIAMLVAEGERVAKGQRVALVEAMKMEHALTAPRDGTVTEVAATAGAQVAEGAKLVMVGD